MKVVFLMSLLFCLNTSVFACLNFYYSTDTEGHVHVADGHILKEPFDLNIDYAKYIKKLQRTAKKIEKTPDDFKLQADYATALIFVHEFEAAAAILSNLAQKHPKEYNIATNLGTAYELLGKDELALKWIKKGLLLNPNSHEGSEWIHVRILETKLALKKEPNYLESHSIIGLDAENELSKVELSSYRVALEYQIRTRLGFTPVPNSIMANLFADLAALYATTWSTHYGILVYNIALKYLENSKLEELYKSKLQELETYAKSRAFQEKYEKAIASNSLRTPSEGEKIRVRRRRINKYYKPKKNELPKDLASKVNLALFDNYKILEESPELEEAGLTVAIQKAKVFALQHLPKEQLEEYNKKELETIKEELSSDTIIEITYDSLQNLENTIKEDTLVAISDENIKVDKVETRKDSKTSSLYQYLLIIGIVGLCIISFILIQKRKTLKEK
ncbi:MAG: hypothetical protein GY810_29760 [Aureispira sp.]|nr:hypothetical protein [Aureispira sp.]